MGMLRQGSLYPTLLFIMSILAFIMRGFLKSYIGLDLLITLPNFTNSSLSSEGFAHLTSTLVQLLQRVR